MSNKLRDYELYELYVVEKHRNVYGHITWHQKVIPENVYFASGYINDWNKHRLTRILEKRKQCGKSQLLPDFGLDFISYNHEQNTYHGGQVKLYNEKHQVRWRDIATFLVCLYDRLKTVGYLYTSKNNLECDMKETINATTLIEHIVLPFETTDENQKLETKDETQIPLRQYQTDSLQAIWDADATKLLLKQATGTGKTVIAGHVLKQVTQKRIVCIAPLLFSVHELYERISPFVQNHHKIKVDSETDGTTDVDEIRKLFAKHEHTIIFTTYKSFEEVISQLDIDYEDTYLLIDEVHNCFNQKTLCEFANRYTHSLYLSATVPEELGDFLEYEIVYEYNIGQAINDGVCVDYKVMLPYIEKESAIPDKLSDLNTDLCNKALFLATGMLQEGKRRCVVYLQDIDEARRFENVIKKVFERYHGIDIDTFCVDCTISKKERERIIKAFRNGDMGRIKIICNVRILNEAINLVSCDCVFKTHPGTNDLTTAQQLGRAIRLDPNNPTKKAVMFVWCEDFSECVHTLQMLKTEDPEFHRKVIVRSMNYDQTETLRPKIQEQQKDLLKYVDIQCLTAIQIWHKRMEQWKTKYVKNGKKPSPRATDDADERRAGKWQSRQRRAYKKGKLTPEQVELLTKTVGWTWEG